MKLMKLTLFKGNGDVALALRKALLKGEKISDPYIGLTEKADSAARAAIDETWGQTL